MKAIVIGGGLGGLSAAIALEKVGIEAHVFERAPVLCEVGAGISLWTNAIDAMTELGLGDSLRAHVLSEVYGEIRTPRGSLLSTAISKKAMGRYGLRVAVIHRADLLSVLMNQISPERLHLDHQCIGFVDDGSKVLAQFAGKEEVRGDVLIGADGLHSIVRARLFGDEPPRYAGYTAWRAVVDFAQPGMHTCETWGRGQRFGMVPMCDGRVYWYATKNAPACDRDSLAHVKQRVKALFRGWHDPVEALIDATDESAILQNDIYDREPLSRWSANRVTLLGDAAHPMTPNLGQGACQAIEDSVVFASCLKNCDDVAYALRMYQNRRILHAKRITLSSRRIGEIAQWENPVGLFVRNMAMRAIPEAITARQIWSMVSHKTLAAKKRVPGQAAIAGRHKT